MPSTPTDNVRYGFGNFAVPVEVLRRLLNCPAALEERVKITRNPASLNPFEPPTRSASLDLARAPTPNLSPSRQSNCRDRVEVEVQDRSNSQSI